MDNSHVGAFVGIGTGIYKAAVLSFSTLVLLSWELAAEISISALIGGAFGWMGSELMKLLKVIYLKYKEKKKNDKKH